VSSTWRASYWQRQDPTEPPHSAHLGLERAIGADLAEDLDRLIAVAQPGVQRSRPHVAPAERGERPRTRRAGAIRGQGGDEGVLGDRVGLGPGVEQTRVVGHEQRRGAPLDEVRVLQHRQQVVAVGGDAV
jgi:hypothetical protein